MDEGQGSRRDDVARRDVEDTARRRPGAGSRTIPSTNLIYYGTSNPGPRVPTQRPGLQPVDARRCSRATPTTGMAKWALPVHAARPVGLRRRQRERADRHPLAGQAAQGAGPLRPQRIRLHHRPADGRGAGGRPFAYQNWSTGIDMKTAHADGQSGRCSPADMKLENVCPPDIGVKDWEPAAFSPRTGLLYAGIFNICMDVTDHQQSYIAGHAVRRHGDDAPRRPRRQLGRRSWPGTRSQGKKAWSIPEQFMVMSGTLATASATSCSTARSMAGFAPSMREPARCSGRRSSAPASSRSPSPTLGPGRASSTSRSTRGSRRCGDGQSSKLPGLPAARQHALRLLDRKGSLHGGAGMKTTAAKAPPRNSMPARTRGDGHESTLRSAHRRLRPRRARGRDDRTVGCSRGRAPGLRHPAV